MQKFLKKSASGKMIAKGLGKKARTPVKKAKKDLSPAKPPSKDSSPARSSRQISSPANQAIEESLSPDKAPCEDNLLLAKTAIKEEQPPVQTYEKDNSSLAKNLEQTNQQILDENKQAPRKDFHTWYNDHAKSQVKVLCEFLSVSQRQEIIEMLQKQQPPNDHIIESSKKDVNDESSEQSDHEMPDQEHPNQEMPGNELPIQKFPNTEQPDEKEFQKKQTLKGNCKQAENLHQIPDPKVTNVHQIFIQKPKRAQNPYLQYLKLHMAEFREQNPHKQHKHIVTLIGQNWNKLSEKEKQRYILLAEQDKQRFNHQMKEFQTLGYFTKEDGSKSTDGLNNQKSKNSQAEQKVQFKIIKKQSSIQKLFNQDQKMMQSQDENSNLSTQSTLSFKKNQQCKKKL